MHATLSSTNQSKQTPTLTTRPNIQSNCGFHARLPRQASNINGSCLDTASFFARKSMLWRTLTLQIWDLIYNMLGRKSLRKQASCQSKIILTTQWKHCAAIMPLSLSSATQKHKCSNLPIFLTILSSTQTSKLPANIMLRQAQMTFMRPVSDYSSEDYSTRMTLTTKDSNQRKEQDTSE